MLSYRFVIFLGIHLSLFCRPPIYCVGMMHCHVVILHKTAISGSCCCWWPYVHLDVCCLLPPSLCSCLTDICVVLNQCCSIRWTPHLITHEPNNYVCLMFDILYFIIIIVCIQHWFNTTQISVRQLHNDGGNKQHTSRWTYGQQQQQLPLMTVCKITTWQYIILTQYMGGLQRSGKWIPRKVTKRYNNMLTHVYKQSGQSRE
jgi:hypothetical protein